LAPAEFITTRFLDLGGDPSRLNWSGGGQLVLTTTNTVQLDIGTALGPSLAIPSGGSLNVSSPLYNSGSLTISNGVLGGVGSLGSLVNTGSVFFNGGTISLPLVVTNEFGGVMSARGTITSPITNIGELDVAGFLTTNGVSNFGQINIPAAAVLRPSGLNNLGAITLSGGAIGDVSAAGTVNNNSGGLIHGGGGIGATLVQNTGTLYADDPARPLVVNNLTASNAGSTIKVADACTLNVFGLFTNGGLIWLRGADALFAGFGITNQGTIKGAGKITGEVFNNAVVRAEGGQLELAEPGSTNTATGQIQAGAGNTVFYTSGLATNAGTIALSGGVFDNNAHPVTNNGAIQGNGTLYSGPITSNGSIILGAGSTQIFAPLTNNGPAHVTLTGAGSATFYGNVTNVAGSSFVVDANSTAIFLGNVSGLGAISGGGTKYYGGTAGGGAVLSQSGTTIVGSSGHLTADAIREGTLEIDGVASVNPNGTAASTSRVNSLIIAGRTDAWVGRLDLTDNALVVDYSGLSPLVTIANQLKTGYRNGVWVGNGIASSSAAADPQHRTALGFAEAANLFSVFPATFRGQTVDNTSVLVRYTIYGDANLDGVVDTLDFNSLAANFGKSGQSWSAADFNFDGVVDTLNFNNLAASFGQQISASTASSADVGALVPEPNVLGSVMVITASSAVLRASRRRARR
jgi:hypothetical protein